MVSTQKKKSETMWIESKKRRGIYKFMSIALYVIDLNIVRRTIRWKLVWVVFWLQLHSDGEEVDGTAQLKGEFALPGSAQITILYSQAYLSTVVQRESCGCFYPLCDGWIFSCLSQFYAPRVTYKIAAMERSWQLGWRPVWCFFELLARIQQSLLQRQR